MEHEYTPSKKNANPDVPKAADNLDSKEWPEYERAGRVRRFARTVLRAVMAEATTEAARPRPLETEPLIEAAEDLREASDELGEMMQDGPEKSADVVGFERTASQAPHRIFEDVVSDRIVERMQRLEAEPEKTRAVSVLAAGLGIVAVFVAGHQYLARRRAEVPHNAELTRQRAEFNKLRAEQTVDNMARSRRQDYYEKLSQFTHRQAEVTRETAHELQGIGDRPRPTWMRERSVAEIATPEQKQAPLVRVEVADTIEHLPSQAASTTGGTQGGSAAAPPPVVAQSIDPMKPPLNPAAMRQEVARKARAAQLASVAWLYGAALGAVLVGAAIVLLLK